MPDLKLFLGRQPILDREQKLVAFEILFRRADSPTANVTDGAQASASTILHSISTFGLDEVLGRHRGFFNVDIDFLMDDYLELLPRESVVLELLETIQPTDEVVSRCRELKKKGFSLALDDHVFSPDFAPLYEIVDIVKMDVLANSPDKLAQQVSSLRRWRLQLLAEKVEDQSTFRSCFGQGFELFQGYYFARPVILNRKHVDVSAMSVITLLNQLITNESLDEIEVTFRQNPTLVFNLLRLVNSVAMGLRERIHSLRHAIIVLGRQRLLRWAHLALFASQDNKSASPLLEVAAFRGRLLELLFQNNPAITTDEELPDRAFMTGVLSLIEVLFGTPMEVGLKQLSLADDVRAALLSREGVLGQLLLLTEALEQNDFETVSRRLDELQIDKDVFHRTHLQAIQWTNNLFEIR